MVKSATQTDGKGTRFFDHTSHRWSTGGRRPLYIGSLFAYRSSAAALCGSLFGTAVRNIFNTGPPAAAWKKQEKEVPRLFARRTICYSIPQLFPKVYINFWNTAERQKTRQDGVRRLCIQVLRACLKSPRARLGGGFSARTSLKTLAIRQDCCGFLPRRAKNQLTKPHTLRY